MHKRSGRQKKPNAKFDSHSRSEKIRMAHFMNEFDEIQYATKRSGHQHSKLSYDEPENFTFAQEFRSRWITAMNEPVGGWPVGQYAVARAECSADPVERAIRAEYRQLRLSSIECYNLDLMFWPATTSDPQFHDGCSDIKFYNFTQGSNLPHTLPVQVVAGLKEELHVLVKFGGAWRPFTKFLQSLINPCVPASYSLLRCLWGENGKTFPLFDLPAEVRNSIYECAMAPGPSGTTPRVHPYRYGMFQHGGRTRTSLRPNITLLLTSRQLHKEAAYILYKFPTFVFQRLWHLESFFGRIGQTNRESLRYIELSFTHKELLKLFGATLSAHHSWNCSPAGMVLRGLQLNKLDLTMPPPVEMVRHDWLWGVNLGCQTKVVDWILGFARSYIQHLPVELDGYVKKSQKERFIASLQYYKDYNTGSDHERINLKTDVEDGGVKLVEDGSLGSLVIRDEEASSNADSEESEDAEDADTEEIHPAYQL